MNVFVCWSGDVSLGVAKAMVAWLPQVLQAVKPFISTEIDKGARWASVVASELEASHAGIICLTNENLAAPWAHFEAGALSRVRDAHVCTLLYRISPAEVTFPLAQFQHTATTRADVWQLVQTLNAKLASVPGERQIPPDVLERAFEAQWQQLERALNEIPTSPIQPPRRELRDMTEEMLELVRQQVRPVQPYKETWSVYVLREHIHHLPEMLLVLHRHPKIFSVGPPLEAGMGAALLPFDKRDDDPDNRDVVAALAPFGIRWMDIKPIGPRGMLYSWNSQEF